ncbi:glycosyltransferase family 4 protein [Algibacter miyuki]|uniref:Glycosyltransferase family 4 protein n=1 Tax=Algibacter miyuki TaxID=1306933 RepID=A0ABV5H1X6_9FLAO|nr:glycosyltransferase [Algibacter miyuki]MDN3666507.1 glycosyltransferase [Algibacter miyuki]
MRFLIITHVLHEPHAQQWYAYAPYVREMNLWLKYVDEVEIVAPLMDTPISEIDIGYQHNKIKFTEIPAIAFINFNNGLKSLLAIPFIFFRLFRACKRADHIHLRCPGNIGLLGCFVQICFPKKIKTAKYAGNWDPNAKQPLSYKFQKWILSNTVLTKNMTVLAYGNWPNQTKNIKPFFTASFKNEDREAILERDYFKTLKFVFVGSLVSGKRPLLAIKIVEALKNKGYTVKLDLYGDGVLKEELRQYISSHNLSENIRLHGNKTSETIVKALKQSHFLILASKSEGWPKAVAEAMFFGTIPIATAVSCVPSMLGNGSRGILVEPDVSKAVSHIIEVLSKEDLNKMAKLASDWSQTFTLDYFESEIKKLLMA